MAITPPISSSSSKLIHLPSVHPPSPSTPYLSLPGYTLIRSKCQLVALPITANYACPVPLKVFSASRFRCCSKSTEERETETLISDKDDDSGEESHRSSDDEEEGDEVGSRRNVSSLSDALNFGIREPVYEVVEVSSSGTVSTKKINRRDLLKSSGLRPRDIRSVDPSLWLTNTMPSLLVRENAILLNLGSLRAIAMHESVFIFNYNRRAGKAFLDALLPRLNPKNMHGGPVMPFELEVVEAALHSRIQRLEDRLMDLDPRVQALLEVLPNRLTAGILEQLRISKQTLVGLGSKAGALKQMLLDILDDSHEIRRLCIVGRNCILHRNNDLECSVPQEKQVAEEEEEEIEMLLENYLQRCESCHNQAERLLDSAREMEDSISVNLSSRRLEVSKFELLLQVGTFCVAVGALVADLEDHPSEEIVIPDNVPVQENEPNQEVVQDSEKSEDSDFEIQVLEPVDWSPGLNLLPNLDMTDKNPDYHEMIEFLKACKYSFCLQDNEAVYKQPLMDFWSTVHLSEDGTSILATVCDQHIEITPSVISDALRLRDADDPDSIPVAMLYITYMIWDIKVMFLVLWKRGNLEESGDTWSR